MKIQRTQPGMIFITAIVSLAVMLLIGITFMGQAMTQLLSAQRDLQALHATAMADAGLNYFIWRQKYSTSPIDTANAISQTTIANLHSINPSVTTPTVQTPSQFTSYNDTANIWMITYTPPGTTTGYQVVSTGTYGTYSRSVRAILQGATETTGSPNPSPQPTNFGLFTKSDLTLSNSSNITGNVGSNGNVFDDLSGGGSIAGSIYAAGAVHFKKNTNKITGINYGTAVYEDNGNKSTNITSSPGSYCSTATGGATTQSIPSINSALYLSWAQTYGSAAQFSGSTLSSASQVTTPIIYCNPNNTSGYALNISTNLPGPVTIFVYGDVNMTGGNTLGTANSDPNQRKAVVIVATGNVTFKGNSTLNGVVWCNGAITEQGNPTINSFGCIIANSFALNGNSQFNFNSTNYPNGNLVPPPTSSYSSNVWSVSSWEVL